MAIATQVVTLNSSTPTLISIPVASETPYEHNAATTIQNIDGSITIFIGNSTVSSTSYGFALTYGQAVAFDLNPDDQLYAIAASGSPKVAVLAVES